MWEVDLGDVEVWVVVEVIVVRVCVCWYEGGVTSFAESLHPGKPSCVSMLLCDYNTFTGGG